MKRIDKKDIEIISCLRKNSREKLKKIARTVGLPISTVYDRIRKMEELGVIKSYSCMIDQKRLTTRLKRRFSLRYQMNQRKISN